MCASTPTAAEATSKHVNAGSPTADPCTRRSARRSATCKAWVPLPNNTAAAALYSRVSHRPSAAVGSEAGRTARTAARQMLGNVTGEDTGGLRAKPLGGNERSAGPTNEPNTE